MSIFEMSLKNDNKAKALREKAAKVSAEAREKLAAAAAGGASATEAKAANKQ